MSYNKVIPRDLFNEANLLKCLGRLSLLVTEGMAPDGLEVHLITRDGQFDIEMDESCGAIYCNNIEIVRKSGGYGHHFRPLNSREPFGLYIFTTDGHGNEGEVPVFDDDGNLTTEFVLWAQQ